MDAADDVLALVISKPYRTEAEAVAIARQMAASGALLAACEAALRHLDRIENRADPVEDIHVDGVVMKQLHAAIIAAGEQP
jgi:hypothetical protein